MIDPAVRAVEAVLFAAEAPMSADEIAAYVGSEVDLKQSLALVQEDYAGRGVELVERGGRWHFQTAADMAHMLRREREEPRRLSRAAIETLAIIAYQEPVSRAEIEAIRGVQISKGTLDVLMEAGWVRPPDAEKDPAARSSMPTTSSFLTHFGLKSRRDLPGIDDLKAAGLLDPVEATLGAVELETADESD